jgi:hypothetical protein
MIDRFLFGLRANDDGPQRDYNSDKRQIIRQGTTATDDKGKSGSKRKTLSGNQ